MLDVSGAEVPAHSPPYQVWILPTTGAEEWLRLESPKLLLPSPCDEGAPDAQIVQELHAHQIRQCAS